MKVENISNLQEFLTKPLWDTHTMIFRGVPDSSYELITSLGRVSVSDEETRGKYEKDLLEEFKRRSYPHLKEKPYNFIDWICLAQHYGLPTRLLDWTTNPLIALFFAVEKHPSKDFAVYKRIQNKWYSEYSTLTLDKVNGVYGIRPPQTDVRFVNQEGVFTIHDLPTEPLDDDNVVKYVFPAEIKDETLWVIKKYGISPSRIYPGLDGVSKDVIQDLSRYTRNNSLRATGHPLEPWA